MSGCIASKAKNASHVPAIQEKLPAAIDKGEPLPEGLLWLLLTGEVKSLCFEKRIGNLLSLHPWASANKAQEGFLTLASATDLLLEKLSE